MSRIPKNILIKNGILPETSGVYLMRGSNDEVLYVGKAVNLRRRAESYFIRPSSERIEKMVSLIARIDYQETDTAIEALILEAEIIKKILPPYNVREKDDKSFLYVQTTKDKFPRVAMVRQKGISSKGTNFGPFTSSSSLREALKIIRRIFPYSIHPNGAKLSRPCFDYQVGLCPGVCMNLISKTDYAKNISNIKLFFKGEKKKILKNLEKEMFVASKRLDFERARKIKRQVFALRHINDVALISESEPHTTRHIPHTDSNSRLEGYDISNISGTSAVGVMVVFEGGNSKKSDYRKFKIKTIEGSNDTGMLKEVLRRRLNHNEWPLPICFLIDGGKGQVNAGKEVLAEYGYEIPVVGIAKGVERKRNDFIGAIPKNVLPITLISLRDEAHRFAVGYHKLMRDKHSLGRVNL